MNVILLESEDGKALKDTYNIIYTDLTDEDYNNAFKYFKLDDSHSPGYYIGYDDEKAGTETYGRGLVKIPAVYIIEPSVGGFTVELYKSDGTKKITPALTPVDKGYSNKVYEITEGTKLTYSIFRNGEDLVEHINDKGNKLSNLKLELYLEGKSIEISKSNSKLLAPELTIPTAYPEGWYSVYAYFTYDQISYCEHFIIYLKEVN